MRGGVRLAFDHQADPTQRGGRGRSVDTAKRTSAPRAVITGQAHFGKRMDREG